MIIGTDDSRSPSDFFAEKFCARLLQGLHRAAPNAPVFVLAARKEGLGTSGAAEVHSTGDMIGLEGLFIVYIYIYIHNIYICLYKLI